MIYEARKPAGARTTQAPSRGADMPEASGANPGRVHRGSAGRLETVRVRTENISNQLAPTDRDASGCSRRTCPFRVLCIASETPT
jgi:hypothetical protein